MLVTNSQGTSRGLDEGETYPGLIQKKIDEIEFHFWLKGGGTVKEFDDHKENILRPNPDLVFFQVGIVECTRRILSNRAKHFFKALPKGQIITKLIHDYRNKVIRLRNFLGLNTRKMTPEEFDRRLDNLVGTLQDRGIQCALAKIPRFTEDYQDEFFPYINEDIELYNSVLEKYDAFPLVKNNIMKRDWLVEGTVHFNQKGHRKIAEKMVNHFDKFFNHTFSRINKK